MTSPKKRPRSFSILVICGIRMSHLRTIQLPPGKRSKSIPPADGCVPDLRWQVGISVLQVTKFGRAFIEPERTDHVRVLDLWSRFEP